MNNFKVRDLIIYGGSICLAIIIFLFLLSTNIIGYSVKEKCQLAKSKYSGDCVEVLITYLNDDQNDIRTRNSAIWALGQLGDDRATPVLESYYLNYNGERCDLDKELSQYMLKRAIKLSSGGLNITAPFWRFGSGIE